jgi:D-alanine-D-alanine ligase
MVLMGGVSPEHEVSLKSGARVVSALEEEQFAVVPVIIGKDARWSFGAEPSMGVFDALPHIQALGVDCVFIALHGPYGEDGRIQGLLDILQVPYTGSGCAASALAMDKVLTKSVVASQGIRVAGHLAIDRATWAVSADQALDAVCKDIGLPCVVKPSRLGSSVGVEMPKTAQALRPAVEAVLAVTDHIMIEEFLTGREMTCAVLDAEATGIVRPLPITEICPKSSTFFDYEAKYTPGASEEITPARIDAQTTQIIQQMAADVHQIVGCAGWSRSDFMLLDDGPVFIEVNTVPGLTETSLFPQAAAAAGIPYEKLMRMFVEAALRRK